MAPAVVVASIPSLLLNWPWALEPITERVMQRTPVDLAQQLILRLGVAAKPLALLGGFAICLLLGGLIGAVASALARHMPPPLRFAIVAALALTALFALFPPLDYTPSVILALAFAVFLHIFHRTPGTQVPARIERSSDHGSHAYRARRMFLADSARIIGSAALLSALLLAEPWYKSLTVYRRGGRIFAFKPRGPRRAGFNLPGLTPEITSIDNFYYLSKNLVDPDLTADGWSLRIDGLVSRPYVYSFDALLALPAQSQYVTQECVSNPVGGPLMSCAEFTGVPLRQILAAAGPMPSATQVVMRAPDGHADSIPLSLALHPAVLVAYGMNGSYLERAHGYPARMLIPGSYGFKSIKWVEHIELLAHDFKGTWQELGWTENAVVRTMARIDFAGAVPGGALVAGVAFAGTRGIQSVQARVNGGPWVTATLHVPPLSTLTWVQWRITLPARGHVTIEARAIDGTGAPQDGHDSDIYPSGATGYHRVAADI
jgi:DMSO/TMAO reductase YedYZ molybdopterin-dependent catalytic subunit